MLLGLRQSICRGFKLPVSEAGLSHVCLCFSGIRLINMLLYICHFQNILCFLRVNFPEERTSSVEIFYVPTNVFENLYKLNKSLKKALIAHLIPTPPPQLYQPNKSYNPRLTWLPYCYQFCLQLWIVLGTCFLLLVFEPLISSSSVESAVVPLEASHSIISCLLGYFMRCLWALRNFLLHFIKKCCRTRKSFLTGSLLLSVVFLHTFHGEVVV